MTATKPEYPYMAYSILWKMHILKEQFIIGHGRNKFSYPARYICCVSLSGPTEIVNTTGIPRFENPF